MSVTISTTSGDVVLKESHDGYEAGIDLDGPYIVKQYLAPSWGVVFPVINALRGTVSVSGGVGGVVSRSAPHACPESSNLYCLSAVCNPEAPIDARDSGRPAFRLPIITCKYGIPKYDVTPTDDPGAVNGFTNDVNPSQPFTYALMTIDFATEVVPIPGSTYQFTSPTLKTNVNVVKTVATANMVFVRKFVPYLPFVGITNYLNKVNQDKFLGQPEGQIKFTAFRTKREYLSDGTRANEIELHFLWRQYDHNKFVRDDTGAFDFLYSASSSAPMYEYVDMKPLLRDLVK
jgi:hypothetical protein